MKYTEGDHIIFLARKEVRNRWALVQTSGTVHRVDEGNRRAFVSLDENPDGCKRWVKFGDIIDLD